ncbi:MAG: putative toxin-antitoxin system toxin component, PIN family [Thermoanaerobaculia bacterium]
MIRAVVDTNVLFEGLTRLGPAAEVIDAWVDRRFRPCVSTTLALEYQDVLSRKLRPARGEAALMALQALLVRCEYIPIYYSYRPASRDPGDDFIVDCVLNSQATLITYNVRDFADASRRLGFKVLQPVEFMLALVGESQP